MRFVRSHMSTHMLVYLSLHLLVWLVYTAFIAFRKSHIWPFYVRRILGRPEHQTYSQCSRVCAHIVMLLMFFECCGLLDHLCAHVQTTVEHIYGMYSRVAMYCLDWIFHMSLRQRRGATFAFICNRPADTLRVLKSSTNTQWIYVNSIFVPALRSICEFSTIFSYSSSPVHWCNVDSDVLAKMQKLCIICWPSATGLVWFALVAKTNFCKHTYTNTWPAIHRMGAEHISQPL